MTKDEALDLALDALTFCNSDSMAVEELIDDAITAIKQARSAPVQEPVAWKDLTYGNLHHQDFGNSIPLYTTPPAAQRQWVGLTDEELTLCHSLAVLSKKHDDTDPSFTTLLHCQIEAKLKEKNT